ncbi:hypothetical protein Bca101_049159 [Brassica carinata]
MATPSISRNHLIMFFLLYGQLNVEIPAYLKGTPHRHLSTIDWSTFTNQKKRGCLGSNNKNNPYSGFIRDHETTPSKLMKLKCSATEVSAPGRRVRVEAVAEVVALAA